MEGAWVPESLLGKSSQESYPTSITRFEFLHEQEINLYCLKLLRFGLFLIVGSLP